ncbi:MAG TPA: sigma 54-interacting transcriptional regulator [Tepidisphaeraceae bacterium]|nr:sigma 54-interacting transcriptional regulator [Tepidisphaeraceae bacterium]
MTALENNSPLLQRYRSLLAVSSAIAACDSIPTLIKALARGMAELTAADYFALQLYEAKSDTMISHVIEVSTGNYDVVHRGLPMTDHPSGVVFRSQQPQVIPDLTLETRWPSMRNAIISTYGCHSTAQVPLTSAARPLGVMSFLAKRPNAFDSADVDFLAKLAQQVAVAVENILAKEESGRLQDELCRQRDRLQLLLDIVDLTITHTDLTQMFVAYSKRLRPVLNHQLASLAIHQPQHNRLVLAALDREGIGETVGPGTLLGMDSSLAGRTLQAGKALVVSREKLLQMDSPVVHPLITAGMRTGCCVPLRIGQTSLGTILIGSVHDNAFDGAAVALIEDVAGQLSVAVANALAFGQLKDYRDKLAREKLYLEDEVTAQLGLDDIIGQSPAIAHVLEQVRLVAKTNATVLLTGETGTGKEVIARAIHRLGDRRDRTLIRLNCAAIPATLLESELFGHEQGAFTGAISQRIGRFELADGGTLFLDEVGDLPLELQPKLLRALQEQEFERLGGTRTIRTDVRIIAATNRDLPGMIAARHFRSDLFYRLNIFPLRVPPLRERAEDIPLLVRHFAARAAASMGKKFDSIQADAMKRLSEYSWPGNLRELQNLIERAVILSRSSVLEFPLETLQDSGAPPPETLEPVVVSGDDIASVQREHILKVLREKRWVVGGARGAAAQLGMKRTTLLSRMKKLGITRPI